MNELTSKIFKTGPNKNLKENIPYRDGLLPPLYEDHIHLYTSKTIFKKIKFGREIKKLNKENRLTSEIHVDTVKIHMALIVNYLSKYLSLNGGRMQNIYCQALKEVSNERYYRICIDLLKKYKFIFILPNKTTGVAESYCVDKYCKAYRWNFKKYLTENDDIQMVKVTNVHTIKKIVNNVEVLQVADWLKPKLQKAVVCINPSKPQKQLIKRSPQTDEDRKNNEIFWNNSHNTQIYVHSGFLGKWNNRKKYSVAQKIHSFLGLRVKGILYSKLTLDGMKNLLDKLLNYRRKLLNSGKSMDEIKKTILRSRLGYDYFGIW